MFVENRIKEAYDRMTIEQRYELMEALEGKHLGANENADMDFMESILNVLLETTTIVAKLLRIVD